CLHPESRVHSVPRRRRQGLLRQREAVVGAQALLHGSRFCLPLLTAVVFVHGNSPLFLAQQHAQTCPCPVQPRFDRTDRPAQHLSNVHFREVGSVAQGDEASLLGAQLRERSPHHFTLCHMLLRVWLLQPIV